MEEIDLQIYNIRMWDKNKQKQNKKILEMLNIKMQK